MTSALMAFVHRVFAFTLFIMKRDEHEPIPF